MAVQYQSRDPFLYGKDLKAKAAVSAISGCVPVLKCLI